MQRNSISKVLRKTLCIMSITLLFAGYGAVNASPAFARTLNDDPFTFRDGKTLRTLEEESKDYPEYFDLRKVSTDDGVKNYVTPVKVQNPYGTCWGFAAISAAESSLISSGLADGSVDLSEKHLAYFVTSHIEDPKSSQNGEGMYFYGLKPEDFETSAYRYNTGGFISFATALFASGMGPVAENAADPVTGDSLYDILAYKGLRNEKLVDRVATSYDPQGNPGDFARKAVWYSSDDDWSIPEKYKNMQSYVLKNSIILPSPYNGNMEAVDAIKQQMYKYHRALTISFCAESYIPGQDTSGKKYMSDKWAHYTSEPEFSNHSVTIVGWDDNYPKENFLTEPRGNGAFLIKNSWGSELNEFPNNGYRHWGLLEGLDGVPYDSSAVATSDRATGYFWMSYYDQSMSDPEAFEFEAKTENNTCDIAQTDLMFSGSYTYFEDTNCKSANVFTASRTSELKDISVMTTVPDTDVTYQIYMLPGNFKEPESGLLIAEGSESFTYGGYHRISVNAPVILAKNQIFSIVVTEDAGDIELAPCSVSMNYGQILYDKAVINEKESYFYMDGEWHDMSDRDFQIDTLEFDEDQYPDNFPIKAYLKPVFDGYLSVSNWHDGTPGTFSLLIDENKTLTAGFRGLTSDIPDDWDPEITWTSSDESVVTVTQKANNFASAVIEGHSDGQAYIKVDAGKYGSRVVGINVRKAKLLLATFDDSDVVYTGKPIEPEIDGLYIESSDDEEDPPEAVEGVDYKVEYKNNVEPGTAKVIVTCIGKYTGVYEGEFTILKAPNTMKASGKTVNLKASDLKKKKKVIGKASAYTIKSAKGKVSYKKVSLDKKKYSKYFSVNKKTGKITVKKGLKKGNYKLTVTVKAAGDKCYKKAAENVTVTIKVK